MRSISRSVLFALLCCIASGSLPSAAQEVERFQQYLDGRCGNAKICRIDFARVPDGKTLEVTNFSCYMSIPASAEITALQLHVLGARGNLRSAVTGNLQLVDSIANGGARVYQGNSEIFAFATARQRFRAYAQLNAGFFFKFACHISGRLLP